MQRTTRIKIVTLMENFNSALVSLGIFFYAENLLRFNDLENLWLGLAMGISIVMGALLSHPLSMRLGERRQLQWVLGLTLLLHVAMGIFPGVWVLVCGAVVLNLVNGFKWPVLESYVTAGLTQKETNKALGWFNIYWSGMVPLGMAMAGPMIRWWPAGMFFLPAAANVVSLLSIWGLERRLVPLADDHPDRPDEAKLDRLKELLIASRWGLLLAFLLTSILNPLLPGIFSRMQYSVAVATLLGSVMYVGRWVMFVLMANWSAWHDRSWPIAMMLVLMPMTFFMILGEHDVVVVVVAGFALGGLQSVAYFTALYYAMVVKNAAVDAGGHHEAIVGMGFVSGPLAALAGKSLSVTMGSSILGLTVGIGPVLAGLVGAGLWPICRKRFVRNGI